MSQPLVRPARPDDLAAVAEFTTGTFSWGDYVADRFVEWLDHPGGRVVVAVDGDDRPIGVARVVLLSPREAWLHAARVHPEHRRSGLGAAMNLACREWAAQQGAVIARLLVEDWNQPARGQVEKLGFRPVAHFAHARRVMGGATPVPGANGGRRVPGPERLAVAHRSEAEPAWMAWSTGELAQASHQLFPQGWLFRRMTFDDVTGAAKVGRLWQCPSGWVIASVDEALDVDWVATTELDASRLVRAVVDRGHELEVAEIGVMIPRVGWLAEALAEAGFELTPSTVYAMQLDQPGGW